MLICNYKLSQINTPLHELGSWLLNHLFKGLIDEIPHSSLQKWLLGHPDLVQRLGESSGNRLSSSFYLREFQFWSCTTKKRILSLYFTLFLFFFPPHTFLFMLMNTYIKGHCVCKSQVYKCNGSTVSNNKTRSVQILNLILNIIYTFFFSYHTEVLHVSFRQSCFSNQ